MPNLVMLDYFRTITLNLYEEQDDNDILVTIKPILKILNAK